MSMMPSDSENPLDQPPCTTIGCTEPATLIGTFIDHDIVREGVAYCTYCAGYLYQQFEITSQVRR